MATRTPGWEDIPGGYPDCTPRSERARYVDAPSSRSDHDSGTQQSPLNFTQPQSSTPGGGRAFVSGISTHNHETPNTDISPTDSPTLVHSGENTALTSPSPAASATSSLAELTPIRTAQPQNTITRTASGRELTEDELFRTLSQRSRRGSSFYQRSSHRRDSGHEDDTEDEDDDGHDEQIERLLSQIFGQSRQDASVEEQTRHRGIVFRNLTVKGIGHGAALKATNSDILLGPLRKLWGLVTLERMRRGKPVRTIIDDFTGVVRPKEMCLVLARPGGGASTFLKVIGNQRSGFEAVEGDVVYGGTGAKEMAKKYRNEVLYNPEDDLHYATLTVEETLRFALKTRTPGKESRKEGESRGDYVREFLRSVAKLFWIEHTMGTKVGNDIIRGVSGGEKKRVSIAEAMVTKASVQCWDNSTKGLDASTATVSGLLLVGRGIAYEMARNMYHPFVPSPIWPRFRRSLRFIKPERDYMICSIKSFSSMRESAHTLARVSLRKSTLNHSVSNVSLAGLLQIFLPQQPMSTRDMSRRAGKIVFPGHQKNLNRRIGSRISPRLQLKTLTTLKLRSNSRRSPGHSRLRKRPKRRTTRFLSIGKFMSALFDSSKL